MFTDYSKRENRIKRDYTVDFKPELDDDFFGFSHQEAGFTFTQTVLALIIGLPVFYGIGYILLAMTPNI